MYQRDKVSQAVILALSAGTLGTAAQAQEERRQIEEITVTATKVEETLQEVPIAVSALTGEAVEELGICLLYTSPSPRDS